MQSSDTSHTNCNKSSSSDSNLLSSSINSDEKISSINELNIHTTDISFIYNSANELMETKSTEKQNGEAEVLEVLEGLRSNLNSEKTRHNSANSETDNSFTSSNGSLFQLNRSYLRALQEEGYYNDEGNGDNDNINFMDLRELFSEILDHLDALQTQIDSEKAKSENIKNELESKIKKLSRKNHNLERDLYDIYDEMYDEIYSLDCRIIRMEQYSRRESLVISGIPEYISQADLEPTVLEILRNIGVQNLASYHISACHRLAKNYNDPYPARTVVKFINRKVTEFCIENRNRLKELKPLNMNLRFFHSMCYANEQILKECNYLHKFGQIESHYIRNGFIKIIKNNGSRPKKINHICELHEIFKEFYEYEDLYAEGN